MEYLITIVIANVLIGGMIGMTGIAGFLLPMLYSGFLGMPSVQGLALSFFAFLISGVLGAYNYYRAKHLDLKLAVWISAGSFVGAIGGVRLNLLIEEDMVKKILYLVVLLSGISILLRKESEDTKKNDRPGQKIPPLFWMAFGAVTGLICALSGAGGPILVMPLLVVLKVPVRTAVGIALFDSVFIAIPSSIGYGMGCSPKELLLLLPLSLISHGIGVWAGSRNAALIRPDLLKKGVAVFSVLIALYKLIAG
nr:sulfite exporter TauE/SafE family protein [uncultured Sellimonas sp.]